MSARRRKGASSLGGKNKVVEIVEKKRQVDKTYSLLRLLGIAVFGSVVFYFWLRWTSWDVRVKNGGGSDYSEYSELDGFGEMFEVVNLPGRGKGLVATRDIKQGELVIKEKPLFVVPKSVSTTTTPAMFIAQKVRQLIRADGERYMKLSYVGFPSQLGRPDEHPAEVALAIFQTNAVAINSEETGIFPRMARLNHGCAGAFNVVYHWREKEGALVVHALKLVKKGEELLTTYMNTRRSRSERREALLEQYGFNCSCKVCSLLGAQSTASDARLVEISKKYEELAGWARGEIDGREAIDIVRRIWAVEDEEGYWSERGRLAADAAYVAAAHSDASAVQIWARVAAEWYGIELGTDSEEVKEMKWIEKEPENHPGWGWRDSRTVMLLT